MNTLQNYSSLIAVVKQMEADLGLSDLSEAERLVIAAIGILHSSADIERLINFTIDEVKKKFNIILEPEIKIIGEK